MSVVVAGPGSLAQVLAGASVITAPRLNTASITGAVNMPLTSRVLTLESDPEIILSRQIPFTATGRPLADWPR
jgi:hypothetical protein